MLLLLTGMETDLSVVRKSGRAAFSVSVTGIAVPFACGFGLGELLPDALLPNPGQRLITSLFIGTALSISSVKIVAMVVREMNFMRRTVGQVIVASAIIDDTIGWTIMAITFGLALHGGIDPGSVAQSILGTALFLAASFTFGRRVVFRLILWANDNLVSDMPVITTILVITGLMALITHAIGVHTVLGAFVAGILVGESPILTKHIDEQLRGIITAFFAPVFFGVAGLSADLTVMADPTVGLLTVGLIVIASIGKFGGAFIGAELGGLTKREGLALACGMNARGSTEVIIATVGLSMGALNQNLFTMIVAMAVLTTTAMPPTLRWALARIPLRKEEKQRLEREEQEAKGFVANLERLLIAIDDSSNGKFASRVAGILAGTHAMPATVMHITKPDKIEAKPPTKDEDEAMAKGEKADNKEGKESEKNKDEKVDNRQEKKAEQAGEAVKAAAKEIKSKQKEDEKSDSPVEVTTVVHEAPDSDVIAEEAKKGYDLLVIGLEKTVERKKEFHESITGGDLEKTPGEKLSILVPVNGTDVSRRGAEVAITMARANKAPITVLYVAARNSGKGRRGRNSRSRQHEEAILKDIVAIADGYNMSVRTAVLADRAADEAILREIERHKHNLVVLGVGRRPGDKLFFGDTAAALLEKSKSSLLFLAS
jgi:Kef-type K+ transport system membrane component KefB/nucleotide-binding universal stress UspA family protein